MKDVGIILSEAADTEQAVEGTVEFVTMDEAQFSHPHGEIAVAVDVALARTARAVHRFDGVRFVIDGGEIHVFTVMIPVTGLFPEMTAQDGRRADFIVFGFIVKFIPEFEQCLAKDHAFGVEEREARAFFVEAEQVELFAQFTMIALFGFFQHVKVIVKVGFLFKSRTVNTLEHLVVFITAPVGTGNGLQFEGFNGARGSRMGAGTEIDEIALTVEGNFGIFRQDLDQFNFIILTGFFKVSAHLHGIRLLCGRAGFSLTILAISASIAGKSSCVKRCSVSRS